MKGLAMYNAEMETYGHNDGDYLVACNKVTYLDRGWLWTVVVPTGMTFTLVNNLTTAIGGNIYIDDSEIMSTEEVDYEWLDELMARRGHAEEWTVMRCRGTWSEKHEIYEIINS